MSDRSFRRRVPATRRNNSLPKLTSSSSRRTPTPRKSKPQSKPVKILQRCYSEPILYTVKLVLTDNNVTDSETQILKTDDHHFNFTPPPLGCPFQSPSPSCSNIYSKEAKVVVTVTVEGSPGPVRMMVKLGWSVEETIRVVMEKYREEGRTPPLDRDATASSFHLHHSCFSFHNLDRQQTIGEVGSRSFYLRKGSGSCESSFYSDGLGTQTASSSSSVMSQVVSMRAPTATPGIASPPSIFSLDFIRQSMHMILRKMYEL
ncbi:uncharacterized protein At4g22758-like isoform X2 [Macadamia integrifolia]|nr:uncharacterized protein At4g22758-like isoform X2 [Macadamia integrifolia]